MSTHRWTTATALGLATSALVFLPSAGHADARPTCAGRPATIVGTAGADHLKGTRQSDVIVGLAGNDVIDGHGGDDFICGGAGADRLNGDNGDDDVRGQAGADRLSGDQGDDTLRGGAGSVDILYADDGNDYLIAGAPGAGGKDLDVFDFSRSSAGYGVKVDLTTNLADGVSTGRDGLTYPAAGVSIVGTPYDDTIIGGTTPITLRSLAGQDTVTGSPGADRIEVGGTTSSNGTQVSTGAGRDVIEAHHEQSANLDGGSGRDLFAEIDASLDDDVTLSGGGGSDSAHLVLRAPRGGGSYGTVTADLAADQITATNGAAMTLTSFDSFHVSDLAPDTAQRYVVRGTAGDNTLSTRGAHSPARLYGLGGSDLVQGSIARHDLLDGGPGHDRTGPGHGDTCVSVESDPHHACAAS